MTLQILGQLTGHWSNCGVTRGLARGLAANGADVQVFDAAQAALQDDSTHRFDDVADLKVGYDPEAKAALFIGYPVQANVLHQHRIKIGAFISESSYLPPAWVTATNAVDLVVVPSSWLKGVMVAHGIDREKVLVVPHGLDAAFAPTPGTGTHLALNPRKMRFYHITGARDFPWRKGTPQLIAAFAKVFGPGTPFKKHLAKLVIRTPPGSTHIQQAIHDTQCNHLFEIEESRDTLTPGQMRHVLLGSGFCAVIQPSAAEAYGIVPCEARACGLPVIMTRCTGHTQHWMASDVIVKHGREAPMRLNGIPNGQAPEVAEVEIVRALLSFVRHMPDVLARSAATARNYYERNSWEAVTPVLATVLKKIGETT